jgi:hypothetical protein
MLRIATLMKRRGWKFMLDPTPVGGNHDAYHRKYWRYAKRGDLEVLMHACGRHLEMNFFQSVANQDNPNGARYDFDKMKRMPVLLRYRTQVEHNFLSAWCLKQGLVDTTDRVPAKAMERIEYDRAKCWHWPKDRTQWPAYIDKCRSYGGRNCIDADGVQMNDGDVRYLRGRDGRLRRCRAYYKINNMWWAVISDTELRNVAAYELFSCEHPAQQPRRYFRDLRARMDSHIRKALERKDYLKAHHLQLAMERQCPIQKAA